MNLDITPEALTFLDIVVLTFVIMERKRRDREKEETGEEIAGLVWIYTYYSSHDTFVNWIMKNQIFLFLITVVVIVGSISRSYLQGRE